MSAKEPSMVTAEPDPPPEPPAATAQTPLRRTPWAFPAFVALFVVVWTIRATVGFEIDRALDPAFSKLYSNAVKLALWVVPAAAFAYGIRGESRLASLRLGVPPARTLPLTTGLIVAYLTGVAIDVARKHGLTLSEFGAALAQRGLGAFVGGLPSAFAEEALFRGLVLTELGERTSFWPANLLSGVLFVAMHWPHRIWRDGLSGSVFADAPALLAIALALGFVARRSGSIWPAVVFHAANNALSGVLS
jgi:membrane protease YdiL (CAAX protease family)